VVYPHARFVFADAAIPRAIIRPFRFVHDSTTVLLRNTEIHADVDESRFW